MAEDFVQVFIDGKPVEIEVGSTILEAAQKAGVQIPTLCKHPDLPPTGTCRICLVEVEGARGLVASCVAPVAAGMKIFTNTPAVREARKTNLELLLSAHPHECLGCIRNNQCDLQALAEQLGVREEKFSGERSNFEKDESTASIVRDPNKCILCRRCVAVCDQIQNVSALGMVERGFFTRVAPAGDRELKDVACALCGQCITVCPVGAIHEREQLDEAWKALNDPQKYVVVQTAPAVRVALGEEFGMAPGTRVTGKMVAALRRVGFKEVYDTDFAADLTIMEEAHELLERLNHGGKLPLITSCSPGWVKFCEHFYPELLENLSSCKSPHEMLGALIKTYFAEKHGLNPADIFVVSVMPCVAKKFEAGRPELGASGYPDIDLVLTTRELARMIKQSGIDFLKLPDEDFDDPFGESTGASVIFGTTGGVMEAALRTAYEWVTKRDLPKIEFEAIRGMEGVREAMIAVDNIDLQVAVAHGLGAARKVLDSVKEGSKSYQFIEIMACPGGCIGGGGQPFGTTNAIKQVRRKAVFTEDEAKVIRKSHQNPAIQKLYQDYLGEPGSEKAHHLLHTHYTKRPVYSTK